MIIVFIVLGVQASGERWQLLSIFPQHKISPAYNPSFSGLGTFQVPTCFCFVCFEVFFFF